MKDKTYGYTLLYGARVNRITNYAVTLIKVEEDLPRLGDPPDDIDTWMLRYTDKIPSLDDEEKEELYYTYLPFKWNKRCNEIEDLINSKDIQGLKSYGYDFTLDNNTNKLVGTYDLKNDIRRQDVFKGEIHNEE